MPKEIDWMDLELTPYDEDCAQVGDDNYQKLARLEYSAMYGQLLRMFGTPLNSTRITCASNQHDFGTYYSLRVLFDTSDPISMEYAYKVEGDWPAKWDAMAIEELKHNNYKLNRS